MSCLYIVSTYYHALITCVKQLTDKRPSDILVTDYIPEGKNLVERLDDSSLFEECSFVGKISEYIPTSRVDKLFYLHSKNTALIEKQLTFDFEKYDEINLFHDDIWTAHYLKSKRIKYRLIEDSLDFFKSVNKTHFRYMLPKSRIKLLIKRVFRIGYVFFGYDSCVTEVEVNDKFGLNAGVAPKSKLNEVPRKALFEKLTREDTDVILKIFAREVPKFEPKKSVLLLTQPMFEDGYVGSREEQIRIYKRMAFQVQSGETLVIKPHPRDFTDYTEAFPKAIVLDKNMPAEVLAISGLGNFKRVISVSSSAVSGLDIAQKHN